MKTEWFERWFGEEYISLYPHRNVKEAERVIALIERTMAHAPVSHALDLACGAGRHSGVLAKKWWTTGLDLSEVLLKLAHREQTEAMFVRGDMRVLPFRDRAFDLVVNLFTSFGYFKDDESHHEVVDEVARVTAPGGTFVLDFLNTTQLRNTLVAYDEREIGGQIVEQRREISDDDRFVIKKICIRGSGKEFTERVRLFEARELSGMMTTAGFDVSATYGNYDGSPLTAESPRAILFGCRR
jgi:ubiquinone/menaquinone biosynthesis C-methylase UbiE